MADLKTNYKDRLLDTSVNTERKFNLVDSDGNIIASGVSLRDITQYSQTGDMLGAADINKITAKINEQNNNLANVYKTDYGNVKRPVTSNMYSGTFSYTAPKNGILYLLIEQKARTPVLIKINDYNISSAAYTGAESGNPTYVPLTFFLSEGDTIKVGCSSTAGVLTQTTFVPFL